MMRSSKPNILMAGATVALALGLFACSAASPTSGGFGNTNNDPNAGNTTNGATTSSSGGSNSGGSSTTGSSSGGSSTTGGSSGGSSGGGTARRAPAAPRAAPPAMTVVRRRRPARHPDGAGHHDGPGRRDRPGRTRRGRRHAVRDAGHGVRGGAEQEIFPNFCVTVPSTIQVGGFQSWMSEGSSHHFILYKGGAAPAGGACTLGANTWIYASSTPGQVITENMPPNVGLQIASGTQLILNMHFINPGTTTLYPKIKSTCSTRRTSSTRPGRWSPSTPRSTSPRRPRRSGNADGERDLHGAHRREVLHHEHAHPQARDRGLGRLRAHGVSQEIVHTGTDSTYPADQEFGSGLDWEHPGVGLWVTPNFLTVSSGDSFTYHCSYSNTGSTAVTVGETAASNEMCMAVG